MLHGSNSEGARLLIDALLSLKDENELTAFLEDVCTINELQAMAQRMEVASLLDDAVKYNDIASRTGASTATISRVNRSLNYGAGGYKLILQRLKGAASEDD
ncbi:MAG: TrpR-like protein [Clostridia bacterium]|nr:TrpR-like protein [Clostridia bacterium]